MAVHNVISWLKGQEFREFQASMSNSLIYSKLPGTWYTHCLDGCRPWIFVIITDANRDENQPVHVCKYITSGRGRENGVFMYIVLGQGIKTGSACALVCTLVNGASGNI